VLTRSLSFAWLSTFEIFVTVTAPSLLHQIVQREVGIDSRGQTKRFGALEWTCRRSDDVLAIFVEVAIFSYVRSIF
jgi:hypothetical protein